MRVFFREINFRFQVPDCCFLPTESSGWHMRVVEALTLIQSTTSGKKLFEDISKGKHQVILTTHPLTKDCKDFFNKCSISIIPTDEQGSKTPSIGSESVIYMSPETESKIGRVFTLHHYENCSRKLLVSPNCAREDSPCAKSPPLSEILFHELVHARNYQQGKNKYDQPCFLGMDKNEEEANTIAEENAFLAELSQLENPPKGVDFSPRYLHRTVKGSKRILHKAQVSAPVRHFLLHRAPATIQDFGQEYAKALFDKKTASQDPEESPSPSPIIEEDDEDLYGPY